MPRRPARLSGFTLLEILLAMAVALILLYLSAAGYTRLIESAAIDGGAQMVNDTLTEARQDAMTQNETVEVRLYAAPAGNAYTGLQLHWRHADGTTPAAAPAVILPSAAVIDATPAHFALVTTPENAPASDPGDPRFNPVTRCFHFLPDGSTDLTAKGVLTVRAATQADPAKFPANRACVEVDPMTGRAQVYRP